MQLKDFKVGKLYRFTIQWESFGYPAYNAICFGPVPKQVFQLKQNDIVLCIENQKINYQYICKILFKEQIGYIYWSSETGDEDLWKEL
jgi:hypothetical protein